MLVIVVVYVVLTCQYLGQVIPIFIFLSVSIRLMKKD